MLPTILKVFSTNPKNENNAFDYERNDENSVIRISHLDGDNQNQLKSDPLCNIIDDTYSEVFPLCKYESKLNNEYEIDTNKDVNVLEDFYRFQQRRNALLDNKKTINCTSQIQQKTAFERPNYSYTQLIYMAIESSANKALTVNDIYNWCEHNFPYYAHAIHGWKNSLRHNLSINKCFKKITKMGIGGRGSLWVVDPRERQHLVSTMCRSNVTYFPQSIIIQKKLAPVDRVPIDEPLECVQVQCNTVIEEWQDVSITEKPRLEWTDTRLDCHPGAPLSPDRCSLTSDTDYNDWQRSVLSLVPTYPVKNHWYNQNLVTPALLPEHNYCLPDVHTVLNNPSSVVRHSFLSSSVVNPPLDSFSTSSDYNDEDWPRTPSPMSIHHLEPLPAPIVPKKAAVKPLKSSGKKRGRPRKDGGSGGTVTTTTVAVSPAKTPKTTKSPVKSPLAPTNHHHHRNGHTQRINNMYNLNNFFNSL